MEYVPTIGLEIHAELKTRTKMFCNSKNDPDETRPNVNVCPVCMGHPGTLPVINREAVKHIIKVGLAVGGKIADVTEFDRKNYFYPDIPKGYQLSQYAFPLVRGGELCGVVLTRVHLEEDTATSSHEGGEFSLIDFNRAGVPLMELVTEPVLRSAKESVQFARELQLLLRYLGASDANLEKGEMRVEANVSVSGSAALGTKVEVKNLNSFRAVERAIEYEIKRQCEILKRGERVMQETRGFDETTQETFSQRRKEESHDYRYFPDPDLPRIVLSQVPEFSAAVLQGEMPELPAERRERLARSEGLKAEEVEILVANRSVGGLFEDAAKRLDGREKRRLAWNYIASDLMGLLRREGADADSVSFRFTADEFAELIEMVVSEELSSRGAKEILNALFERGGTTASLVAELGLLQKSGAAELSAIVRGVIAAHPSVVADYKKGKRSAIQFLVGQGMKAARGAANPKRLQEIFAEQLA